MNKNQPKKTTTGKKDKDTAKEKTTETKGKTTKTTTKSSGHKTVQSDSKLDSKKREPSQSDLSKIIPEDTEEEVFEKTEPQDLKHSSQESGTSITSQAKEPDLRQSKKSTEDKTDLMHQLNSLKKENDDLKKKSKNYEKETDQLYKDISESQKKCQEFLKEMNEMTAKTKKTMKDFAALQAENVEMKKKMQILEEDNELLNEELETTELELKVAEKNFNEKMIQILQNQNGQEGEGTETATQQQVSANQSNAQQSLSQDQLSQLAELEEVVSELSQNLLKATEERDYAIKYYKSQIEDLNQKVNQNKDQIESIPKKDELISQLTEKLQDVEGIIEVLQTQITALSPANNMYEQIIIEKDDLEIKYQELFVEHRKLKEDFSEDEELIREQETIMKLSEKMIQSNQNELLNLKKANEEQQSKLVEAEEKEKALMDKIGELKKINQIIKEEISKVKDTTLNIDDVLNKNISTSSKIKMYERQRVLYTLETIDTKENSLFKKIISAMVPKKMFDIGSLDLFEKFITVQGLRKKTFALIFSLIDNDLLNEELLAPVTSPIDDMEAKNLKKTISFYSFVTTTVMEFNCVMFSLEIHLSKDLNQVASEEYKQIYLNVLAGKQLIDILIGLIKEDSFSIQYNSNCEGLRTIVNKLNEQLTAVGIGKDNLIAYYKVLVSYFANVVKAFRKDRIEMMILDDEHRRQAKLEDTSKCLIAGYKTIRKVLSKIDEKFFFDIKYEFGNEIFDINSSYYSKVQSALEANEYDSAIEADQPGLFMSKYEKLVDWSNKLCVVVTSSIEKFIKDHPALDNDESTTNALPLREWDAIARVLNDELESIAKTKEDLEKALEAVKEARLENGKLQSRYEDLNRSKTENDNQLASLLVKIGKIDQLESENLEFQKKVEKYKTAVDDLSKKDERNKIELNKYKRREEEQQGNNPRPAHSTTKKNRFPVPQSSGYTNEMIANFGPTMEILDFLKKETKYLKSKIIKEKLTNLIEDDNSYMNKYIKTDNKISHREKDKDFIHTVSDKIKNMSKGYEDIRSRMSIPSILDIGDNKYNYSQIKSNEETQIRGIRVEYMKNANEILSEMFGDKTLSLFLNEQIDYDISKRLKGFDENKISIGKIRIQELKEKASKDNQPPCVIPLLLSEGALKSLNKTFIN